MEFARTCKHFIQPLDGVTVTATAGAFVCPWCEIERLTHEVELFGAWQKRDVAQAAEIERLTRERDEALASLAEERENLKVLFASREQLAAESERLARISRAASRVDQALTPKLGVEPEDLAEVAKALHATLNADPTTQRPESATGSHLHREYHANGTYWSGVPTMDLPCDYCGKFIMEHDPRTHACPELTLNPAPAAAEQVQAASLEGMATEGAASLPCETRADPLSPAEVRQIVREELERFHGARIQPSIHSPACATVRFGEAECDCVAPHEAEAAPDHQSRTITSLCDRLDRIYLIALDRSLHANERLIQIRREVEGFARVPGEKA